MRSLLAGVPDYVHTQAKPDCCEVQYHVVTGAAVHPSSPSAMNPGCVPPRQPAYEVIKKPRINLLMPLSPYRFFLPYRFAGYLHLSQSKRFMHMRPPSKKSFVQLPLTSGVHTFAAKTLLGANSP